MQLDVLGCGDAYDKKNTNASLLVVNNTFKLLIDCGPTVPQALFQRNLDKEDLQAIYFTHTHPDHCLGLTTLLNWMDSMQRTTTLTIIGPSEQVHILKKLANFASWPKIELLFSIDWQTCEQLNAIGPWKAKTVETAHAVTNFSLCLEDGMSRLFYSGDGMLTPQGQILAENSDIVFVECEYMHVDKFHGSWESILHYEPKKNSQWLLYHVDQACREALKNSIVNQTIFLLAEDNMKLNLEQRGHYVA